MKKTLIYLFALLPLVTQAQVLGGDLSSPNSPNYTVNVPALGSTKVIGDSLLQLIYTRQLDQLTDVQLRATDVNFNLSKVNGAANSLTNPVFVTPATGALYSAVQSGVWANRVTNGAFSATVKNTNVVATDTALIVQIKPESCDYYTVTTPLTTGLAVVANATDFASLRGSATRTVYVTKITIEQIANAATNNISVIKRSTANTGGTSLTSVPVAYNSTSPASTGEARFYTANPTALGTALGRLDTRKHRTQAANATVQNNVLVLDYSKKPIVLNGILEFLCLNLNAASAANSSSITFEFYEK